MSEYGDDSVARTWAAIMAASVGVWICLYQNHFVWDWSHPERFPVIFTHRCGLCLVAAVCWMGAEVAWQVLRVASGEPWSEYDQ